MRALCVAKGTVVLMLVGCGGPQKPKETVKPAPVASAKPQPKQDEAVCGRVCAVQLRCGGDPSTCRARCLPVARTLAGDVLEAMVACVESKAPAECEPGEAGQKARMRLVGACTIDATQSKGEEARANVDLFASAMCDRTQTCGVEGTFVKATCMGKARGAILSTQGEGSGAIYGALRPTKVDEMVKCLRDVACENRKQAPDEELERCLDAALASAATESP